MYPSRSSQQEEGLRNLQRAVELDPRNLYTLQQIAISYQALRRYADAIAALALLPLEKDVSNGSSVVQHFAITAAWAGEKELALQQLEAGLRAPAATRMVGYGSLTLLPFWDPLRGDPRFEPIVASPAPK
jgi:tetratricopeptide (TPR) repeat protein